jgi:hypothetical protein
MGAWMTSLETRAPRSVLIVATAHKLARIAWAVLSLVAESFAEKWLQIAQQISINETPKLRRLMAYPEESICLADVAKPSQSKVPANLILASAFSFCFQ